MGAPARIDRERIVEAAVVVLDREGVERFSMRLLGQELGVDPMAVYHHVPNKAALFDAIVDDVWRRAAAQPSGDAGNDADHDAEWREAVVQPFRALRQILGAHPHLCSLLGTRPATTPAMLDLVERLLGRLERAGLAAAEAMPLLDCLTAFTIGKLLGERGAASPDVGATLAALTSQTHPRIVSATASYRWSPDEGFERGLRAIVGGWQVEEPGTP